MWWWITACRDETPAPPGRTFPTPWEDAVDDADTVSGGFLAEVGSLLPGAGWFASELADGEDAATVDVVEVGGTWPVVRVRIVGRQGAGWDTLELDVALDRWVAGEVPLDGEAAVGQLTARDGEVRYLVGGTLVLTAPGLAEGERAEGTFDDVPTRR